MEKTTPASFNITDRLLPLNGLAAAGAVLHHAIHWVLMGMFYWTDRYRPVSVPNFDALGSPQYNLLRLVDQFSAAAVPSFLFVSGFYIAFASNRGQKALRWSGVFLRIRDLLIPYLIWCTAYLLLEYLSGDAPTVPQALWLIATGGLSPPFYYVILLVQLYLLAPLLVPLARWRWKPVLVVAALLQAPGLIASHVFLLAGPEQIPNWVRTLFFDWHVPAHIFWFLLGIVVGMRLPGFKAFLQRSRAWLLPAAGIAGVLTMVEWEWLRQASRREWLSLQEMLFNRVYSLLFISGFLGLPSLGKRLAGWLAAIGAKSYGIYLMHSLVLEIIARMTYHFAPGLLGHPLVFLTLLWGAGVLLPFAALLGVEYSPARRYIRLLTGD